MLLSCSCDQRINSALTWNKWMALTKWRLYHWRIMNNYSGLMVFGTKCVQLDRPKKGVPCVHVNHSNSESGLLLLANRVADHSVFYALRSKYLFIGPENGYELSESVTHHWLWKVRNRFWHNQGNRSWLWWNQLTRFIYRAWKITRYL